MLKTARFFDCGLIIVASLLVVVGCSNTALEDLEEPLLWWETSTGLCSRFIAVDGRRRVWIDEGCERRIDFEKTREVSAQSRHAMDATFDALPSDPMASLTMCGGVVHRFGRRRDGGSMSWTVCGSSTDVDEFGGLTEPFLGLARAFAAAR